MHHPTRPPVFAPMLLGLALALTGCAGTDPVTPGQDRIAESDYPEVVLDPSLEDKLVANEPIVVPKTDRQPMAVRVPLRSVVQKDLRLEYRFVFYAADRRQTSLNPTWRSIDIPARARRFINAQAISMDADSWNLEVRPR